ncbi:MAG: VOC family protein, partial [Actinomycetota bacterium]
TFPDSKVNSTSKIYDTPSGDCDVVSFTLAGHPFMAISAGPPFTFNPSVSFMVACATKDEVDDLWKKLNEGGKALMPLDSYPFSERYGWTEDRYGLSWQISYAGDTPVAQTITPSMLFVGDVAGKAGEAIDLYTSIFPDSGVENIFRYGPGQEPEREGTVMFGSFKLCGQEFAAMDSANADHNFAFNEAISLMVSCEDQAEIDRYWDALSAVPEAEQCGWLKDRFGLSWQIVPKAMDEMMGKGTSEQQARVTQAFLQMKKFDLAALQRAYDGAQEPVGGST